MDGWMDGYNNRQMDGWMDGWMDIMADKWMDGHTYFNLFNNSCSHLFISSHTFHTITILFCFVANNEIIQFITKPLIILQ